MDGIRLAKRFHVCLDCRYNQSEKYKNCPECGSINRQYFMSETEFKRGMTLMTMQAAGTIQRLKFQHRFDIEVEGQHICQYISDASYYQDGKFVVEDSKSEKFMDDVSKIKLKLFEAVFRIVVKIPQRKSGDRTEGKKDPQLF